MEQNISSQEKIEILNKFVLHSNDVNEVLKFKNSPNIFKILKIAEVEIRHSNILSWLLDSAENHNLGDLFIKTWLSEVIENEYEKIRELNFSIEKLMFNSINDFTVYRERWNIDILLVSQQYKQIIAIENKIWTTEHDAQLLKYENKIKTEFKDFEILFLYLKPFIDPDEILSSESWFKIGYETVKNSLIKVQNLIKDNLKIDYSVKMLIDNYLEIIRSEIMDEDTTLKDLSAKIYKQYKQALDIIFENKPDIHQNIRENITDTLSEYQDVILLPSVIHYIRFTTSHLHKISNEQGNGKWLKEVKDVLVYEINNIPNQDMVLKLMIGPSDNEMFRNSLINKARENKNLFKVTNGLQWTQIWKKTLLSKHELEDFNDEAQHLLEKRLKSALDDEIIKINKVFIP